MIILMSMRQGGHQGQTVGTLVGYIDRVCHGYLEVKISNVDQEQNDS